MKGTGNTTSSMKNGHQNASGNASNDDHPFFKLIQNLFFDNDGSRLHHYLNGNASHSHNGGHTSESVGSFF